MANKRGDGMELPAAGLDRFREWERANPQGFSKWAYLRNEVSAENAVLLMTFLWPCFVEHDGMVLLGENFRVSRYEAWRRNPASKPPEFGALVNHVHLEDFFSDEQTPPYELLVYLGQSVRDMWESRLARDFPDRAFEVRFDFSQAEGEYVLSFAERTS